MQLKNFIKKNLVPYRLLTSRVRLTPDFIVIGVQKSGTTSLYKYMVKHPHIAPAFEKEIHFFDYKFNKGLDWYRLYFPTVIYKYFTENIFKHNIITGEATANYIFDLHAPRRISELLPKVKLIVLLRNPVDRAYSHYHHQVKAGREHLSFDDCVKTESERLKGEITKILADENYFGFNYRNFSYLLRGVYIDQLKRWFSYFTKDQILIIESENLFENPSVVVNNVFKFLGLPKFTKMRFKKYNSSVYTEMDKSTREYLVNYFKPHNSRLYKFLGRKFSWDQIN